MLYEVGISNYDHDDIYVEYFRTNIPFEQFNPIPIVLDWTCYFHEKPTVEVTKIIRRAYSMYVHFQIDFHTVSWEHFEKYTLTIELLEDEVKNYEGDEYAIVPSNN